MLYGLYTIIGCLEILVFSIAIAKYIYLEKSFQKQKDWIIFFSTFFICSLIVYFLDRSGDWNIFLPFLFFALYILITRKKRKLLGIFLILPVLGMMISVIVIPVSFLYLFSTSMKAVIEPNANWMIGMDIIFWLCVIWFLWKGKKWRIKFDEIAQNRFLAKWERNLLHAVGLFFLLLSLLMICMDEIKIATGYAKCFVGFGILIIIIMEISIIAMVMQGNNRQYFQNVATVNEHYLKAQLEHFQTYQETQKETRRIYHDMKNQIACLYSLLAEQKYEESSKYISDLNEQVQHIDKELHSGNLIIDAILNEKNAIAKRKNIRITIDGRLEVVKIDAIDICTIFSNALDNAMEALNGNELSEKEIQVLLKTKNGMQYIRIQNPVENRKYKTSFLTTKGDYINHGFGLGNIRLAVEKYHGQMDYGIKTLDNRDYFVMEIMVFT